MGNTGINYATKVWNPIEGCFPCSPGCDHCWARKWANRAAKNPVFCSKYDKDEGGKHIYLEHNFYDDIKNWDGTLAEFPRRWDEPLRWNKPQRIFVGSRSDIALWRTQALDNIEESIWFTRQYHRWLALTKRPKMLADKVGDRFRYLWLGVTVCNQAEADEKILQLLATPAAGYWLSVEPMLEEIIVPPGLLRRIGWVVCGGESGKGARQMEQSWEMSLRKQCRSAGVPYWLKQFGDWYTRAEMAVLELGGMPHELPEALKL